MVDRGAHLLATTKLGAGDVQLHPHPARRRGVPVRTQVRTGNLGEGYGVAVGEIVGAIGFLCDLARNLFLVPRPVVSLSSWIGIYKEAVASRPRHSLFLFPFVLQLKVYLPRLLLEYSQAVARLYREPPQPCLLVTFMLSPA